MSEQMKLDLPRTLHRIEFTGSGISSNDQVDCVELSDRLFAVWEEQKSFVDMLIEHRGFPQYPVDLRQKPAQQLLKGLGHDCMHELFEALQHLKNAKAHRNTEETTFDRDAFLEECVDAFKLYLEVLIYAGVSVDEFFEAYSRKSRIVKERLQQGY